MINLVRRLSLRSKPDGAFEASATDRQPLFLTAENLTFPGVTVIAGTLLNALVSDTSNLRIWVAGIIAAIFGGFITWVGLTDPLNQPTPRDKKIQGFVGFINTALLWISILGVASI